MTGQLPPGWTVTPPQPAAAAPLPAGWTVTPPSPEQEFRNGPLGFMDNMGRRLAGGASFGFADEIAAGMDALTHPLLGRGSSAPTIGERYDANLQGERGIDRAFERRAPVLSAVGDVTGMIGGTIAAPLLAPGKVAGMIPAPTSMLGKMALGGTAGGAVGAVEGFGTGEGGFTNRAENAATHGAIGAGTGALIPPMLAGVGKLAGPVLDKLGLRNADKAALNQTLRAFERDGISPEDALVKLREWRAAGSKPEALVDLGGENVRALATTAANLPGKSRQAAMDLVEARKGGASERVGGDMARAISPSTNYSGTIDELMASRRRAADPLYEKMRQAPTYWDPELEALMKRPSMKDAWAKAQRLAAEEGVDLPKVWKLDEKTGEMIRTGESRPDWASWDYIKRGLDEVIEGHKDQFGKMTDTGRTSTGTRKALLDILDAANPDYKAARAAYSGPSQSIDAMKLGRTILSEDADITAKKIAALDPGDKEFFRAGVVKAIQDKVENTIDGRNVVASFFNKPALRNKLAAAFDSPEEFRRFEALMKREMDMATTNNAISPRGGSQTMRLLSGAEDMKTDPHVGPVANLLNLQFGTAAKQALTSMLRPTSQSMNSNTADALAPLLFQQTPEETARVLRGLIAAQGSHQAVGAGRAQMMPGLLGGAANAPMGLLGPYRRQ
jgi:hypothetical protein